MSTRARGTPNVCTQMRETVEEWRPYFAALAERVEALVALVNPLVRRVDAHDARLTELDALQGRIAVLEADRAARIHEADRTRKRALAQRELDTLTSFTSLPAFLKSLVSSSPLPTLKRHVYTQVLADPDRSPRGIATAYLTEIGTVMTDPKTIALLELFPVAL